MSAESNPRPAGAAPADPLAGMWASLFAQSTGQTQAIMELMRSGADPQEIQRRWLDTVAQSLENFMRTPVYLEAMQRSLKMITEMKTMQDRFIEDMARQFGLPLAADITGLFERVHSIEQTILARLKAIETNLKAIETKLEAPAPSSP